MTIDQEINIFIAIGTWLAAISTFAAVLVALYLSKRVEKVKLLASANILQIFSGDGTEPERVFCVDITNIAERNVIINGISYVIGKKAKRHGLIIFNSPLSAQPPKELGYGDNAKFMSVANEEWLKIIAESFIQELTPKNIGTFIVSIETSVGQTVDIKLGKNMVDLLLNYKKP